MMPTKLSVQSSDQSMLNARVSARGPRSARPMAFAAALTLAICGCAVAAPGLLDAALLTARAEHALVRSTAADATTVALFEIDDELTDRQTSMSLFGDASGPTVRKVVSGIIAAGSDSKVAAIVIRLKDAELNPARVEELGEAITRARKAGKKVHLFSDNYGPAELRLGSFCNDVMIQTGGGVSLPGIHMDEMFLADTFAWAGVRPDFVQVGDYKGASEQYANSKPSEAWNKNIDGLLDAMYRTMRDQLKAGRKLDDAALDKAMEVCWMASDQEAIKAGLIDRSIDLPDLTDHLEKVYARTLTWSNETEDKKSKAGDTNPFTLFSKLMNPPEYKAKRSTIAVVHVDGAIVDGESTSGGLLGGASVGSRTIRRALAELEDDKLIKGVVLRIDSPGGSAIASEVIWQGVKRLGKVKPVWVSVGSMAASGGYYIAVAGDKIYVTPSSIVGSIGVVGGKFAMGGLFEKLHINTVSRSRGPRAAMESATSPWSESDRALVRQKMKDVYTLFTSRVSQGRAGIDLASTAEGRLFVGRDAVGLKMADKVGTLTSTVDDLASELKLASGSYDVMDFPAPQSFEDMLKGIAGGFGASGPRVEGGANAGMSTLVAGSLAATARQILGDQVFLQTRDAMNAATQLRREKVILVSPSVLIFK